MLVYIEIDKVSGEVSSDCNVLEAAKCFGVDIPHFCYHKKLSIAANCRMCLVQIEGSNKLVPACATKVVHNLKVLTRSKAVLAAQRSIMEFLLINHPLDCPICDQGGECELQDISISYGSSKSRFLEKKRILPDVDLGDLIISNMSRCILCTRCIRFCTEIAGTSDLGKLGRGVHSYVSTFLQSGLNSNISANIIDLCPVGALCSKPFRFTARAWELKKIPTISPHDCIGTNLYAHVKDGKIYRMTSRDNELINECWISDRDRFGFEGIYHDSRLVLPSIKEGGNWRVVDFEYSLKYISDVLMNLKEKYGQEEIVVYISPNSSLEEIFLAYKIFGAFGLKNISHTFNQYDFEFQSNYKDCIFGSTTLPYLEKYSCIFLIEADVYTEQPLLCVRLNKQKRNGGVIFSISTLKYYFPFDLDYECITTSISKILNNILQVVSYGKNDDNLTKINDDTSIMFLNFLKTAERSLFLIGSSVLLSFECSVILDLCRQISVKTGCDISILSGSTNAVAGNNININCFGSLNNVGNFTHPLNLIKKKRKVFVLFNLNPEYDINYFNAFTDSLRNAEFVVTFYSFDSFFLRNFSNVIIPIALFYELNGSFLNISGIIQSINAVSLNFSALYYQGWFILIQLAKNFGFNNFCYDSVTSVRKELFISGFLSNIEKKCNFKDFSFDCRTTMAQRGVEEGIVGLKDNLVAFKKIDDILIHKSKFLSKECYNKK